MLLMRSKLPEKMVDSVIEALIEKRQSLGLSHEKLGELSGLHRSTISLIESRKRQPTLITCIKMAIALKCDLSELIRTAEHSIRSK